MQRHESKQRRKLREFSQPQQKPTLIVLSMQTDKLTLWVTDWLTDWTDWVTRQTAIHFHSAKINPISMAAGKLNIYATGSERRRFGVASKLINGKTSQSKNILRWLSASKPIFPTAKAGYAPAFGAACRNPGAPEGSLEICIALCELFWAQPNWQLTS